MNIKNKSYILLLGTLFLASCSDNDWNPGPEDNSMGVFFNDPDTYNYIIEPDDNHVITVTMGRIDDSQAASVPLKTVSCPEGVVLPASVEFSAGQKTASIVVDCSSMPAKTSGRVEILVDPAYFNLYAAGSSMLQLDVTMTGEWVAISEKVRMSYSGSYSYSRQTTQLLWLEGTDQFKIPNFAGSGLDLFFKVSDPTEQWPDVLPYKNVISFAEVFPDDDDSYECWYLYDDANQTYPEWSPDGSSPLISYAMFYGLGYSYIGINDGYGDFTAATTYDDGSEGWLYVTLSFTPSFNPFELEPFKSAN